MKIEKNMIPEGFTIGLVILDGFPVLFFGAAVILLGTILHSALFAIGAALCFAAGTAKVLWKLIVTTRKKNIRWLFVQMRYFMPGGFALMILGTVQHRNDDAVAAVLRAAVRMPVLPFLLAGVLGFALMGIFAAVLNSNNARSNWIEQITNTVGQFSILMGIILLTFAADCAMADDTAVQALTPTASVGIFVTDDQVTFTPATESRIGLIFYPGGKVDHAAYAPLLHRLAENGITCVAVKMPLELALFDADCADRVMEEHPEIEKWYLAGHSLGGVMAAQYAGTHPDRLDGVILLAAYSTKPLDGVRAISIYGSEDAVLNRKQYEMTRDNFPADVVEIEIPGGNHSQFGSYGKQPKDNAALISPQEQWDITCNAIMDFIDNQ